MALPWACSDWTTAFRPSPRGRTVFNHYRRLEQLDEHLADRWRVDMAGFLERLEVRRTKWRR